MSEETLRGFIKTIKRAEGYGFITHAATGDEYFFHRSAVDKTTAFTFDTVYPDQEVEFLPTEGPKGSRATFVRPL